MPNRTIYIRNEDLDKWQALDNKSEFVHKALNFPGEVRVHGFANVPNGTKLKDIPITIQPISKSFSARKKHGK